MQETKINKLYSATRFKLRRNAFMRCIYHIRQKVRGLKMLILSPFQEICFWFFWTVLNTRKIKYQTSRANYERSVSRANGRVADVVFKTKTFLISLKNCEVSEYFKNKKSIEFEKKLTLKFSNRVLEIANSRPSTIGNFRAWA